MYNNHTLSLYSYVHEQEKITSQTPDQHKYINPMYVPYTKIYIKFARLINPRHTLQYYIIVLGDFNLVVQYSIAIVGPP